MKRITFLAAGIAVIAASYTVYIPTGGAGEATKQSVSIGKSASPEKAVTEQPMSIAKSASLEKVVTVSSKTTHA
ncbi:hypothetical protein HQN89_35690 [Paenibacillus frigoriresistens]|uniref:hypothetical protein n=1 Tax=Paenibacillus alginolyticus TaxID=59839 RepID=UPI0015667DEB|nr:hypothetical protein [Paenibacillus frigoriresistens]NRF96141.1 hypothetical protein [Paenibacillus frigoriresistens]